MQYHFMGDNHTCSASPASSLPDLKSWDLGEDNEWEGERGRERDRNIDVKGTHQVAVTRTTQPGPGTNYNRALCRHRSDWNLVKAEMKPKCLGLQGLLSGNKDETPKTTIQPSAGKMIILDSSHHG
uniref:Uncharacterized protein n=1 Tax=Molossus molossus TaxID=27622 RepID=A0A7J8GLD0_MOLMO|nr:hypothetical protein HJG59_011501 [Molossus molossus]